MRLNESDTRALWSLGLAFGAVQNDQGVAGVYQRLKKLDPQLAIQFYNTIKK